MRGLRAGALALLCGAATVMCGAQEPERPSSSAAPPPTPASAPAELPEGTKAAVFAGGCFWCMEAPFDALPGVISTTSGYTGGTVVNPTYKQVSSGGTGHLEAIRVVYRPEAIRFEELLEVFWRNVDPLDSGGQFCDRGSQYGTAIFVNDESERSAAEASKSALEASGQLDGPIVTPIREAVPFYAAEDYHQDYYQKNALRYRFYRNGCGRDARLEELWGEAAGH